MKELLIFTNLTINKYSNIEDEKYDFVIDRDIQDINGLYYFSPKIYWYYLFIDKAFFKEFEQLMKTYNLKEFINHVITLLDNFGIIILNNNIRIYHRSLIHYIYPYPEKMQTRYSQFSDILEYPFTDFKRYYQNIQEINIDKDIKKYFKNILNKKTIRNIISLKNNPKNYLDCIDIHEYMNIEHPYFKNKIIKFHQNARQIYGDNGLYNFRHDFRNVNRNAIINHLIYKNNFRSYLEIGVYNCYHFSDVKIDNKIGVDPYPDLNNNVYKKFANQICIMTSETFFTNLDKKTKFDIIFIDGCLLEDNIYNDISSSIEHLNLNGCIIVHDCNPPSEFFQRDDYEKRHNNNIIKWNMKKYSDRNWNGKTWKAIIKLRKMRHDLEIYVIDTDWGVGIIKFGMSNPLNLPLKDDEYYKFDNFSKYKKEMLNLITVNEFLEKFP